MIVARRQFPLVLSEIGCPPMPNKDSGNFGPKTLQKYCRLWLLVCFSSLSSILLLTLTFLSFYQLTCLPIISMTLEEFIPAEPSRANAAYDGESAEWIPFRSTSDALVAQLHLGYQIPPRYIDTFLHLLRQKDFKLSELCERPPLTTVLRTSGSIEHASVPSTTNSLQLNLRLTSR